MNKATELKKDRIRRILMQECPFVDGPEGEPWYVAACPEDKTWLAFRVVQNGLERWNQFLADARTRTYLAYAAQTANAATTRIEKACPALNLWELAKRVERIDAELVNLRSEGVIPTWPVEVFRDCFAWGTRPSVAALKMFDRE